ncbi:MAG TPA: acyl-CoA dehydrogenase, partial [Sorangium sp.]|nr:acyl-CoA dehydrogenase [Sorangium sp.]
MNIDLNDTQRLIQSSVRDYTQRQIAPHAAKLDEEAKFPHDILRGLAELGVMGVNVPADLGGAQAGAVAYALAMMEVARGCASTAVTMAVTNMVGEVISTFGDEAQRQRHVPKLTAGEYTAGAFALSEPGAGSDPAGMTTQASKVAGGWQLNGEKQWITSGDVAGVMVVWARTDTAEQRLGAKGISCFLVTGGTPGLTVGHHENKMGLRASSTVALSFDNCFVPDGALLGGLGDGFKIAMMALDGGRIGIASQAVGIATAALAAAKQYALDRKQF